jgi:predicted extracellular nuclease
MSDLNDQGFSPTFAALEAGGALIDPINRLPLAQRYDYDFDGDSETLSGLLAQPRARAARDVRERRPHQR